MTVMHLKVSVPPVSIPVMCCTMGGVIVGAMVTSRMVKVGIFVVRRLGLMKMMRGRVSVMVGGCMVVGGCMGGPGGSRVMGHYVVVGGRGLSRSRVMNRVRDTVVATVSHCSCNVFLNMLLSVNMFLNISMLLRMTSRRVLGHI